MKKFFLIALSYLMVCSFGSCSKEEAKTPDEPKEFVATSFNGQFLEAISNAYDYFVENDEMPVYVNIDGIRYTMSQCYSVSTELLDLIQTYPDTWQEQPDVDIPKTTGGSVMQNNTFEQDSISIDAVKWMINKAKTYADEHGSYPNYVTFGTRTWKSDRSGDSTVELIYTGGDQEYVGKLIFPNAVIIMARIMNYYKNNLKLPTKVSTWWSDFLRSTNNCPIDDATVVATMQKAIGTATTPREKAEKIFLYARDEWEWLDYSNTRKGAVTTINEKGGNCCDLSHAIIAMSRAAGIPARYIHGQCYFSSSVIGHVISEVYVDGEWYIVDASNNNATFGHPTWKGMETFNGLYKELPF